MHAHTHTHIHTHLSWGNGTGEKVIEKKGFQLNSSKILKNGQVAQHAQRELVPDS